MDYCIYVILKYHKYFTPGSSSSGKHSRLWLKQCLGGQKDLGSLGEKLGQPWHSGIAGITGQVSQHSVVPGRMCSRWLSWCLGIWRSEYSLGQRMEDDIVAPSAGRSGVDRRHRYKVLPREFLAWGLCRRDSLLTTSLAAQTISDCWKLGDSRIFCKSCWPICSMSQTFLSSKVGT